MGGFGAALRLDGLLSGGRYVEWGRVRRVEPGRVVISGTVEQ